MWARNNWFLDIQDPLTGVNPFVPSRRNAARPDVLVAEAESVFKILNPSIDVGTVPHGNIHRISVPIEYTGGVPLFIASNLASDLLSLDASSSEIKPLSKEFKFLLNTEAWDGPFAIPFPVKVHYKSVTLDQTVTVRGNIFKPISVTQKPLPFTNVAGQEIALALRNNTNESLSIASVGTAGAFDIIRLPESIPSGGTGDLVLRLASQGQAEVNHQIRLNLSQPFLGKQDYYLTLHIRSAP